MEPALTTTFKNIQFIPICQVIVLTGTALISFIVAYGYGDVSIYLPFISETGAKVPAMCLFTYGLFFGAVAGSITVCYRFLILNHMLANAVQWLKTINTIAVFIGLLSMAGLAGVAAFPVSSVIWAHLVAAGVHFVGGLSYIILQTVIDYWKPATNKLLIKIRILLCLLLLLFLFLLVICFPVSFYRWHQVNESLPAVKMPIDEGFGLVFASAVFEWLLYAVFLAYIALFTVEFRSYELVIGVLPVSPKADAS